MDYKDQLTNLSDFEVVDKTGGNDTMTLTSSKNVTLSAGAGNDTIYVKSGNTNTVVNGGDGNDSIKNEANEYTKVFAGAGKDTIINSGYDATLDGGDDDDYILNYGGLGGGLESSINGGKGNDNIVNAATMLTINGGEGNDYIQNSGLQTCIFAEAGDDTIINSSGSQWMTIDGGAGNDYISHDAIKSTITGGAGNDIITLGSNASNNVIKYAGGDGNDTIYGFSANDTLHITSGTISKKELSGDDVLLTIGSGTILLKNAADITLNVINADGSVATLSSGVIRNSTSGILITGTPNADTIDFAATYGIENVSVNAEDGDDSIVGRGYYASLNGQDGNDYIEYNGNFGTIDGGAGNDTIDNWAVRSVIYGGAGNDSINNRTYVTGSGNAVTINGGDGDDEIINSVAYSVIDGGAGKDRIYSTSKYDNYISIRGGDDDDVIYNSGNYSTIYGDAGNDYIENAGSNVTINAGTGNDTIKLSSGVSNAVVDFTPILNNSSIIYGYNSNTTIHLIDGIVGSTSLSGSDLILSITTDDSSLSSKGTITIKNFASVGFVNIVDYEGNFATIGAAAHIENKVGSTLISGTEYDDYILNHDYNANKVTISGLGGDDTIENWGASVSINAGNGNDSIFSAGSYSTIDGGDGDDFVSLKGAYNSEDDYQASGTSYYGTGNLVQVKTGAGKDSIYNYGSTSSTIDAGDDDDFIDNNAPRASILGGAGNDDITNYKPYSTIYGGADNDTIRNTNITGYGTNGTKAIIYGDAGDDYIWNSADSVSVYGGEGNDTIINTYRSSYASTGVYSYLEGGAGNDYISNTENNVTINGGTGNDTVKSTGSNTTIIYASGDGNDLIENFQAGTKLKITGNVTATSLNASDVILTVGSGSLTLKGAKGKDFSLIDSDGTEVSTLISAESTFTSKTTIPTGLSYNTDHTVLTVSDQYSGALAPANYDSVVDTINAGNRTKAINITGNANDNSIAGGSGKDTLDGGTGNDTLKGGAGIDNLTGGAGDDVFQYADGDGNDIITDFGTGNDIFKLTSGSVSAITTSKRNSDVVLTIGKGKVTFKDALSKAITIEDKNGNRNSIVGGINTILNTSEKVSITGLGSADSINNAQGAGSVTASGGAGNDTVVNYGYDALIDVGAGNDYVFNEAGNTTIKGGAGNDTVRLTVWNEHSIVDAEAGNDVVILGQYGDGMGGYAAGTLATTQYVSVNGGAGNDSIVSYVSYHSTINGGAGNDTIDLSERANNATTSYKTETLVIRYESKNGGKDVINNYAEGMATIAVDSLSDIKKIATGGKKAPNDVIFTIGKGNITVKDGAGKVVTFVDEEGNISTQAYGTGTITASDSTSDTIDISKDSTVVEVDASNRNKGVTIIGNAKNNTLAGGSGDDVLTGGKGKDVFIYSGGNDTITDYTAGQDIIKFSSGTYLVDASLSAVEKNADIIFYTNTGSITIQKAVKTDKKGNYNGSKITVIDGDDINTGAQLYDSSDVTVANADGNTFKANLEVINVNASKHSKALYLMGNGNDNSLLGGGGADTIIGFGGNDIMTGGKGKDTFILSVGEGNDTITDYTAKQDKIQIASGVISTYNVEGKDVIFTLSDTTTTATNYLTVTNGKDKAITIIDSSGNETSETYNDPRELVSPSRFERQ